MTAMTGRLTALLLAMAAISGPAVPSAPVVARPMCRGPLTGRSLTVTQPSFGAVQGQPPLPLRAGEYVLSFDDGPSPATTRTLLSVLRDHCVTGAFMMVGRAVDAHPELVRAIVAEGHAAGSHSWAHKGFDRMGPAEREADIMRAADAVTRAAGDKPPPGAWRLFRIPGDAGAPLDPDASWMAMLARDHLILAGYDISPQDWRNDGADAGYRRLFATLPDRGVIVMHDWPAGTPELLARTLAELRRRGDTIVSIRPGTPR